MQPSPIPPPPIISLPWEPFELGSATDLAAISIAVIILIVTGFVAFRQLGIMHDQAELMRRQTKMMEEQTAISTRQEEIAKRQGEIAETQHSIMLEQAAKTTDLRVEVTNMTLRWSSDNVGHTTTFITLVVNNLGTKGADGFHWEVFVPRHSFPGISFVDDDDNYFKGVAAPFSDTEVYDKHEGHYHEKLFPMSEVVVTRIAAKINSRRTEKFVIKWRIRAEDGLSPPEGLGEIHFKRLADGMFAIGQPKPGTPFDGIYEGEDSIPVRPQPPPAAV